MKMSHFSLILISGLVWFAVGCGLLNLGLGLLMAGTDLRSVIDPNYQFLQKITWLFGGAEQAVIMLIVLCLIIGYMKGKYVLGKSARQGVERILSFPNPTSITNIYSAKYYILLFAMIGLGMSIKFFGVPSDIRGIVDTAIGAALINGSVIYFKLALNSRQLQNQ